MKTGQASLKAAQEAAKKSGKEFGKNHPAFQKFTRLQHLLKIASWIAFILDFGLVILVGFVVVLMLAIFSSGSSDCDSSPTITINVPDSDEAYPHQIQNIHGSIDEENTILGIDGHEAEDELLEFTKTYRLLSHSQVKKRIDFSQEYNCIKFFGHSLGEADYSYFQSIFDGLDLYSAKTKLFFYFDVYDPKRRSEIISQNYHAVSKLLKHYGETFKSNPDHGKNLMHKLILEGRLEVKDLYFSVLNK